MVWRSSGVSFTRYAAEMAALLRQIKKPRNKPALLYFLCLKEPYRTQAKQRNQIHLKETVFQNGQVLNRETFNDIKKAFEAAGKQGGDK